MQKQKFFNKRNAQADYSVTSAVEEETILKTRANPKSRKSRGKQFVVLFIFCACSISLSAQKHFYYDGIDFDYKGNWQFNPTMMNNILTITGQRVINAVYYYEIQSMSIVRNPIDEKSSTLETFVDSLKNAIGAALDASSSKVKVKSTSYVRNEYLNRFQTKAFDFTVKGLMNSKAYQRIHVFDYNGFRYQVFFTSVHKNPNKTFKKILNTFDIIPTKN